MTQENDIRADCLALVGMDVIWPGGDGLEVFEQAVFNGSRPTSGSADAGVVPMANWLSKVIRRAWKNAGLVDAAATGSKPDKVTVLYALDNPSHAQILRTLEYGQAVDFIDASNESNPMAAMLENARQRIAQGKAEVVVLAVTVDLTGQLGPEQGLPEPGMGFARGGSGELPGAAAGALVLMPYARAIRENRRIYSVLLGMASVDGRSDSAGEIVPPMLGEVRDRMQQALAQANAQAQEIGYLEVVARGQDSVDGAEIAGMCQAYRIESPDMRCAFGSVQSNLGNLSAQAGLFGVLRTALCLYGRMLPLVPAWQSPKLPALWRNSPFYAPTQSAPWFTRLDGRGRLAGVNLMGHAGSFAHIVFAEAPALADRQPPNRSNRALERGGFLLFPLSAANLDGLLAQLDELRSALTYSNDLPGLAAEWYAAQDGDPLPYGASIVGHTVEELQREVELAQKALPAAFEKQSEWHTPAGSCFTATPTGLMGQVAFVYPGAFNSYPWAGKDLFRLFPWLHQRSVGRTLDVGKVLFERDLYPRSLSAPTKEELAAQEERLLKNPVAMLASGSSLAILFTHILREGFQIHPAAAFGYSLGENSMLFAMDVWQDGDAIAAALQRSPLFHKRLAGPQNAIREAWHLPPAEQIAGEPLWNNFLVMAPVEAVREQVQREKHVYITHINTPRQVVIGGDPQACQRVMAALRCPTLQAPFDYALHCDAMASEMGALTELHDWPLACAPDVRMYSADDYQPMQLEPLARQQKVVAQQIARMLSTPLDFPRLVRQVYQDGARVFIEVGAGGNCARWVGESLKGEPHLALSINRRGTDDYHSLVRMVAKLHCHRVPMNLSVLYQSINERVLS